MTRQEAVKILRELSNFVATPPETDEAINMAIAALEHDKKEIINMKSVFNLSDDLISRQAAIDAFDGVKVDEKTEYDIGYNDGIDLAVSKLSVLPSAQPFTEEQIQTMQELESAQVEKAYELGKADRPTGHWIFRREFVEGTPFTGYRCSNCNYWQSMGSWNFCPNCGADMRGGEEE